MLRWSERPRQAIEGTPKSYKMSPLILLPTTQPVALVFPSFSYRWPMLRIYFIEIWNFSCKNTRPHPRHYLHHAQWSARRNCGDCIDDFTFILSIKNPPSRSWGTISSAHVHGRMAPSLSPEYLPTKGIELHRQLPGSFGDLSKSPSLVRFSPLVNP